MVTSKKGSSKSRQSASGASCIGSAASSLRPPPISMAETASAPAAPAPAVADTTVVEKVEEKKFTFLQACGMNSASAANIAGRHGCGTHTSRAPGRAAWRGVHRRVRRVASVHARARPACARGPPPCCYSPRTAHTPTRASVYHTPTAYPCVVPVRSQR